MNKNTSEINNISLYNAESIGQLKKKFFYKKKISKSKYNKIIFIIILIILIICLLFISKLLIKIIQNLSTQNKKDIKFIHNFIEETDNKTLENKNTSQINHNKTQEKYNNTQIIENTTQINTSVDNEFYNNSQIYENITKDNKNKWKKEKLIIHALGEYNNTIYANSFEGLNYYHIIKKMNLMEADFLLTKDEHIVSAHDYKIFNYKKPTYKKFKESRTRGNLTPITFEDLVQFMYTHKELYIITDTKYSDITRIEKEFNEMVQILDKYKDVNERFIIEIYNEKMYEFLKLKNYPFKYFLFTLYRRLTYPYNYTDMENIFKYCKENQIDGIIMWDNWFNERISNFSYLYSIPVYLHTVNDIQKVIKLFNQGAKGIFTDNITNDILEQYLNK